MSLVLKVNGHNNIVIDEETDFVVGTLSPRYQLLNDVGDPIAFVHSDEEAIPLLESHYKANPPQWERMTSGYEKSTWYGVLAVERSTCEGWHAFRDRRALLRDDQPAVFSSYREAKAAADAHLRDGYASESRISDNLKWFEWGALSISGTFDGELDPVVLPSFVSEREKAQVREVAHIAFLEKAIGITTVNVLLALARGTKRTKSDLEYATSAIAVEMPRMLKLIKRSRECGMPFAATAVDQGKALLRELPEAAEATEEFLNSALNLPLQFLMSWLSWDNERSAKLRLILEPDAA